MKIGQLLGFQGRVGRANYALVGILGVLLKHNLDRFLAFRYLHQPWNVLSYLAPLGMFSSDFPLSAQQQKFLFLLALTSIPFIWIGIGMTLKRLRDAGLGTQLVLLFFIPVVNLLFFLFLCVLPSLDQPGIPSERQSDFLSSFLPKSKRGVAVFAAVAAAVTGCGLGWFSIHALGSYGWTLFLAIPFFMGFFSVWLFTYEQPRSASEAMAVAVLSVSLSGVFLIGIALDGVICILMAAPIAAVLALIGAYLAYVIRSIKRAESQSSTVLGIFLAIPLMAGAEFLAPLPTPVYRTHTTIEIAAPPNVVWHRIISFPRIDAPLSLVFRVGIPYPIEAKITGTGLTADRSCIFSSGAFREPILAWEEGKHFAFGVTEEPPLMKELSPYGDIHVRHLEDHDFLPQRADFYLTELPGGRTRLDGWTTYENRMWPASYWRIWTDAILHQIHLRVFRQVKKLAEQD
ncbi:MAG TPA: DUF805 domain-containing protein, partial [Candidatus Acidoferrum sp.]